jgi:hypothetical protein
VRVVVAFAVLLLTIGGLTPKGSDHSSSRGSNVGERLGSDPGLDGRVQTPSARPPQFVVVSFDGSGGAEMSKYWRAVARRVHAHFTFFVSGVYLVDWAHHDRYSPPRHARGRSDIGFAPTAGFAKDTLAQAAAAYEEGNEIGTHFNGHFCAPYSGNVGDWTAADWTEELDQFDRLMFAGHSLPYGPDEVVGSRTPCLEGNLRLLYPLLARRGFRYDASHVARLGSWPWRQGGIWSVPLLELPFVGHTFVVVSMDYNFLANQLDPNTNVEREMYLTLRRAFRTSYRGNRAPFSIGFHFETWHDGAYDRALAHFLGETCRLRDVRCVSIRELVDWLDLRFPRLAAYPH